MGQVIASVGQDFVQRVLSPRQEERVETVMRLAVERMRVLSEEGEQLREDGMLRPGAEGEEVLEGVLIAARDAYEQKKLPYIANVFAWVAVNPHIDAATAHLAIHEAESLSWTQMCLLALVAQPERWQMEDFEVAHLEPRSWAAWNVYATFRGMEDQYVFAPQIPTPPVNDDFNVPLLPEPDERLLQRKLTNRGILLVEAMGLREIPDEDIENVRIQMPGVS